MDGAQTQYGPNAGYAMTPGDLPSYSYFSPCLTNTCPGLIFPATSHHAPPDCYNYQPYYGPMYPKVEYVGPNFSSIGLSSLRPIMGYSQRPQIFPPTFISGPGGQMIQSPILPPQKEASVEDCNSSNSNSYPQTIPISPSTSSKPYYTKKRYLGVTPSGILLTEGNHCQLCKSNRELESIYLSHILKDYEGRVICPVLRSLICPICSATGDNAHTLKYCPMNPDIPNTKGKQTSTAEPEEPIKVQRYKTVRNSVGELHPLKY